MSNPDPPLVRSDHAGRTWHTADPWTARLLPGGVPAINLDNPPATGAEPVKKNAVRRVWRWSAGDASVVFVKEIRPGHLGLRVKQGFAGTPGRREWLALRYAEAAGVPAVRPAALVEERRYALARKSWVLTASPGPVLDLRELWLARGLSSSARHHRRIALIDAVALTLATAHQAGLSLRDVHPSNLLIQQHGDEAFTCILVDLYGAMFGRAVSDREVVRALTDLHAWFSRNSTRGFRLRFLRAYLRERDLRGRTGKFSRNLGYDLRRLACAVAVRAERHAESQARVRDKRIFGGNAYFARLRVPGRGRAICFLATRQPAEEWPISGRTFSRDDWLFALSSEQVWPHAQDATIADRCVLYVAGQAVGLRRRAGPSRRQVRLEWRSAWGRIHRHQPVDAWPLVLVESQGRAALWVNDSTPDPPGDSQA